MAKNQAPPQPTISRYEQFKSILNTASGTSTSDYGGYGKFWNTLTIAQLIDLKIFGVQMIAPLPPEIDCGQYGSDTGAPVLQPLVGNGPPKSCCSPGTKDMANSDNDTFKPQPKSNGRGAASGLIKALKGEFPFDGAQFPPYMWGGATVSASDIQFISDWIDDGLPETDDPPVNLLASASALMSTAATLGQEVHQISTRSTNTIKSEAGQLMQRKNAEYLSDDELCKFRYAIAQVKYLNNWPLDKRSFNSWAQLHGNECQHGWELFLPWHRMLLYDFEKGLQDIVPDVTLPYWDWVMPMYNKGFRPTDMTGRFPKEITAAIPPKYISGIIPTPYRCYLTADAVARLIAAGVPSTIAPIAGYMYNSGNEFFWAVGQLIGADKTASFTDVITNELHSVNPLWHDMRYPACFFDKNGNPTGEEGMQNAFHHHYPIASDIDNILQVNNWTDFGGGPSFDESFGILDMNPHNTIHIWAGGFNPDNPDGKNPNLPQMGDTLNNLTAGYDPIFWGLHSNVDRIFTLWQQNWPSQVAAEPNSTLPGLPYIVSDAWSAPQLGYEYVLASTYFETDNTTGIKMLKTADTGTHIKVLNSYHKATLKLHKVIPPLRSFTVRVFVNVPDANDKTSVTDNDNYAGSISFFGHGDCIGGPGHCAMPAPRFGFDKRPQGHNRPGTYKMDLTNTVKKLVKKGAKNISIKLVTIGTDDLEMHDMLKMEGMSVTFQ